LQTEPLNYLAQTRLQFVNNRRWKTPPISCGSCGKQVERPALRIHLPTVLKFPHSNYADELKRFVFPNLRKFYMPHLEP